MAQSKIIPKLISDLDISIRCLNILKANNITTVRQLELMSIQEISNLGYITPRSVTEIKELFVSLGLTFKD